MATSLPSTIAQSFKQELVGHVVVHKVSGSGLENAEIRKEILSGIHELMHCNVQSVLVSGAGKSLDLALGKRIEHPLTHLRVTAKKDIPHIEAAIRNIGAIFSHDCNALGIPHESLPHSVVHATRLLDGHGETGRILDVDAAAIQRIIREGKLAILPFGGTDSSGNTLNVNADDSAARAAAALKAKKLILYTNAVGILKQGKNGKQKKIDFLDFHGLFHLIRELDANGEFVIGEGMLPKLKAIAEALTYGVPQVHVVQAQTKAMLEELFTRTGSGTLIEKEPFLMLDFPAQKEYLADILQIREECSQAKTPSGIPLLKPLLAEEVTRLLPTTLALRHRKMLVGTIYFNPLPGHPDTAVIGGFAVGENHQNSGYGRVLLENALEQIGGAGFKKAVSITPSDAVKSLFQQYGVDASDKFPELLSEAKKRYGNDEHLVRLFSFEIPQS